MGRVPPTPGLIRVDDDGGDNNDQYDIKAPLPTIPLPIHTSTTIISEFVLLELMIMVMVIMILKGIFMVILKIRKAQISI